MPGEWLYQAGSFRTTSSGKEGWQPTREVKGLPSGLEGLPPLGRWSILVPRQEHPGSL